MLQQVNESLPGAARRQYRQLIAKRRAGTLTAEQYQRLLKLTEREERRNARRVDGLAQLAQLSGKTLAEIMENLGL